ncbi:MAG: hypothetical protein V4549_17975 [Bacteroidota bacterium]
MKIKIGKNNDNWFVASRKVLLFWIPIGNQFSHECACREWCFDYVRKKCKSKRVRAYQESVIFNMTPDYRGQIDVDFQ